MRYRIFCHGSENKVTVHKEGVLVAGESTLFPAAVIPAYAYAVAVAVSALLGFCAIVITARRKGMKASTGPVFFVLAVVLGVFLARLFYCLARFEYVFYEMGISYLFAFDQFGYTLAGAVTGCLLAGFLTARVTRQSTAAVLDAAVSGGAMTLALARLAEGLTQQGIGALVEDERLQFFPLSVQTMYGDWAYAVYMLEFIAALVLAVVTWRFLMKKDQPAGKTTYLFLLLFGASQVLLESLRQDEYLRWGFVRVVQLFSMGLLLVSARYFLARAQKDGPKRISILARGTCILLGIGVCVLVEFALDKSPIPNWLLHSMMAGVLAMMVWAALPRSGKAVKE